MEEDVLRLFLMVREKFHEVKDKVSLLKTYPELHLISPGIALKIEEFEGLLGFKPEFIYKSEEGIYGISVIYTIDDDVTTGIIAHEFAEIIARERGIKDHEEIDRICVERGFGRELLLALQSVLPGRVDRMFMDGKDLTKRIERLREILKDRTS